MCICSNSVWRNLKCSCKFIQLYPLMFISKTLTGAEVNEGVLENEYVAITWVVKIFEIFLKILLLIYYTPLQ